MKSTRNAEGRMKNEENKIDIPSTCMHMREGKIIFPNGRRLHISAMVELPFFLYGVLLKSAFL